MLTQHNIVGNIWALVKRGPEHLTNMFATQLGPHRVVLIANTVILFSLAGCQSPYYADRGALVGGVTGAGLGAMVGEAASNEPLAGAAIGTAVGAVTGATIGSGLDDVAAQSRASAHQAAQRAVTLPDIVRMSAEGLSDDVIVAHVQAHGLIARPTAADLIGLRQGGVSNDVIHALQFPSTPPIVVPPPPPVIYSTGHYGPPGFPRHCPPFHHGPRKHVHWGVSFGH